MFALEATWVAISIAFGNFNKWARSNAFCNLSSLHAPCFIPSLVFPSWFFFEEKKNQEKNTWKSLNINLSSCCCWMAIYCVSLWFWSCILDMKSLKEIFRVRFCRENEGRGGKEGRARKWTYSGSLEDNWEMKGGWKGMEEVGGEYLWSKTG